MQVLPVLAVDLVSCEGVVKHQNLVCVLQSRPCVVAVLQLDSGVQQRQVSPDDESIGAVCGESSTLVTLANLVLVISQWLEQDQYYESQTSHSGRCNQSIGNRPVVQVLGLISPPAYWFLHSHYNQLILLCVSVEENKETYGYLFLLHKRTR